MFPLVLSTLLTVSLAADAPAIDDAKSLIATIESLQQPVEDFRCEFEGKMRISWGKSGRASRSSGTTAYTRSLAVPSSGNEGETPTAKACTAA